MAKKSFKNLTVVSVTGATDYIQGSIYSIRRSCSELKGSKGLLISPKLPDDVKLPKNIKHVEIKPFGYVEYSIFMLYQLDDFIETDYCLVVQNDGWVMNGKNWRDEFWNYDYIGAPIPQYHHRNGNVWNVIGTEIYMKNLDWINDPNLIEPQNGGFSLRSKKLLGIMKKLSLNVCIYPPKPVDKKEDNPPYGINWEYPYHNEDFLISAFYKRLLEQNGIKFAPSELAHHFSVESPFLPLKRGIPLESILGCHFFGTHRLISENEVEVLAIGQLEECTSQELAGLTHIRLLLKLGYRVFFTRQNLKDK